MKRSGFKNKPHKPLKRTPLRKKAKSPAKTTLGGKKRHSKTDLRRAKDKLWELTRKIVFRTYGTNCYTCPKTNLTGVNCQGGHVPWPTSILSTECRYDIRFIRAQCYNCNINNGGMGAVALKKMLAEGIDIEAMETLNRETKGKPYPLDWHLQKIQEYEQILNA